MTNAEMVVGALCGVVILLMFICIVATLHMGYTKMDEILESLKNSPCITVRAPLRYGGVWGKLFLAGGIANIVTFPGFYMRRGELNADDLKRLCPQLKRKMAVMQWGTIWLFVAMGVLVTLGKSGWLK